MTIAIKEKAMNIDDIFMKIPTVTRPGLKAQKFLVADYAPQMIGGLAQKTINRFIDKIREKILHSLAKTRPNEMCCVKVECIDGEIVHTQISHSDLYKEYVKDHRSEQKQHLNNNGGTHGTSLFT